MTRRDELHNPKWACPRCITDPGHDGEHECPECREPDTPAEYITRGTGHCSSCGLVYSVSTHPEVEEDLFQVTRSVGENLERDVRDVMESVCTDDHELENLELALPPPPPRPSLTHQLLTQPTTLAPLTSPFPSPLQLARPLHPPTSLSTQPPPDRAPPTPQLLLPYFLYIYFLTIGPPPLLAP